MNSSQHLNFTFGQKWLCQHSIFSTNTKNNFGTGCTKQQKNADKSQCRVKLKAQDYQMMIRKVR